MADFPEGILSGFGRDRAMPRGLKPCDGEGEHNLESVSPHNSYKRLSVPPFFPTLECICVTLVVTVNGPETIWLLADRRLTFKSCPPKDDARKVMFLETTDAVAFLDTPGLEQRPSEPNPQIG